jgi:predicted transcriptional regulator
MRLNRRRSDIEIIGDVLRIGEHGACKTRLMYGVNVSHRQIQRYLGFLTAEGFLDGPGPGSPAATYRVTDSGLRLKHLIERIGAMLEDGGTGHGPGPVAAGAGHHAMTEGVRR